MCFIADACLPFHQPDLCLREGSELLPGMLGWCNPSATKATARLGWGSKEGRGGLRGIWRIRCKKSHGVTRLRAALLCGHSAATCVCRKGKNRSCMRCLLHLYSCSLVGYSVLRPKRHKECHCHRNGHVGPDQRTL